MFRNCYWILFLVNLRRRRHVNFYYNLPTKKTPCLPELSCTVLPTHFSRPDCLHNPYKEPTTIHTVLRVNVYKQHCQKFIIELDYLSIIL